MVKNIEELKAFILWSKEQKLAAVKIDNVEFQFSPLALAEFAEPKSEQPTEGLSEADEQQKKQDEDDLFWSSRG